MAINLGDINFGLGPDTRRLQDARRQILQFGAAVNRVAASQSKGARKAEADMRRQEKAMLDSLQSVLKLNEGIRKTGAASKYVQSTTATFNRLVRELGQGRVKALDLQRGMEDFQASIGRVNRALVQEQATAKRQADQERTTLRLEKAYNSAEIAVLRYNAAVERLKSPAALVGRGDAALTTFKNQLDRAGTSMVGFQRAQMQFSKSMAIVNADLAKYRQASNRAQQAGLEGALRRLADVSILLHGPLSGIAARLTLISSVAEHVNITTAAMVTGIGGAAYAFTRMARSAVSTAKQLQNVEQTFTAISGSSVLAGLELDYTRKTADRAGAAFTTVSKQYARLEAASKGTNLEGDKTQKIFEDILFSAQKLGQGDEELAGTLRAVEQMMSKGQIQAEELRGQLGDRLPGALNIMAEALGVSTQKLNKMMKQGQLTSDVLLPFAEKLAEHLGVDTTKKIDTIVAAEGRLRNAFFNTNTAIDKTIGFSKAYMNVINSITGILNFLTDNIGNVAKVFGTVSGAIIGGLAAIYAPTILSGFIALTNTIKAVTVAMLALNTATLENPLGAIATALVRIGVVAVGAVAGLKLMESVVGTNTDVIADGQKKMDGWRKAVEKAGSASDSLRQALRNQIEAQKTAAEAAFDEGIAQLNAAKAKLAIASQAAAENDPLNFVDKWWESFEQGKVNDIQKGVGAVNQQISQLDDLLIKLDALKSAGGGGGSNDPVLSSGAVNALKNARDTIKETQQAYDLLLQPKSQQKWLKAQLDITKSVNNFHDSLVRAKVPQQQVVDLTNQYNDALTKLKTQEYNVDILINGFDELSRILSEGVNNAMNGLVDSIVEGKDAFQTLGDVGKQVLSDLAKSILQYGVTNPLLNMILGGNSQTGAPFATFGGGSSSSGSGGGGLGDIFGWIGSIFKFAHGTDFQVGGNGGTDSQLVAFSASPDETVHVNTPAQEKAYQSGGDNGGGSTRIELLLSQDLIAKIMQASKQQSVSIARDQIDNFSRFELPDRVKNIQKEPRVRGRK